MSDEERRQLLLGDLPALSEEVLCPITEWETVWRRFGSLAIQVNFGRIEIEFLKVPDLAAWMAKSEFEEAWNRVRAAASEGAVLLVEGLALLKNFLTVGKHVLAGESEVDNRGRVEKIRDGLHQLNRELEEGRRLHARHVAMKDGGEVLDDAV